MNRHHIREGMLQYLRAQNLNEDLIEVSEPHESRQGKDTRDKDYASDRNESCNFHKQARIRWVDKMSQDQSPSHLLATRSQPEIGVCESIHRLFTLARNGSMNAFKQFVVPERELSICKIDIQRLFGSKFSRANVTFAQ